MMRKRFRIEISVPFAPEFRGFPPIWALPARQRQPKTPSNQFVKQPIPYVS